MADGGTYADDSVLFNFPELRVERLGIDARWRSMGGKCSAW